MASNVNLVDNITNQIQSIINDKLSIRESYDYSPILHRFLSKHHGVKISAIFKASSSERSGMSYMTLWRSKDVATPHDGVGMAWTLGSGALYNVYLVDNDTLSENVFVNEKVIREDTGINNFISGAKFELLANTYYNISLKINDNYSIVGKIWKLSTAEPDDGAAPGTDYIVLNGSARLTPYRTGLESDYHFGIAVNNTYGAEWFYDNIEVINLMDGYQFAVFKLKVDPVNFTGASTVSYYGYGFDQNSDAGVTAYIQDSSGTWEILGTNTSVSTDDVDMTEIKKEIADIADYRSGDGYLHIAVRPTSAYGQKNLYTYYVGVDNMLESGTQVGNAADIWLEAPEKIVETTATIASTNGIITLDNSVLSTPIQEIVSVADAFSQVLDTADWELRSDAGSNFSVYPNIQLSLSGAYLGASETFTITYRYYTDGALMQTFIQSYEIRSPGADNYIKIIPPYVLEFASLRVNSSLNLSQIKELIITFVSGISTRFEISDFVAYMHAHGVNYVDTDDLDIRVRGYNYKMQKSTDHMAPIVSHYLINGLGAFYTALTDLYGVVKI